MNEITPDIRQIAHDLNNQIMVVMGALDRIMILSPDEPDAIRALKAVEHCAVLTSRLVPPTPSDATRQGSSVRQIVSEAAMLVRPLLPTGIRIEVSCATDCRIAAPESVVQQALVTLCKNAMEAMNGPGIIRIEVQNLEHSVVLSVSDTGPGVPPFPANCTRIRETIEQVGGSLSVGDVFPHGACFRIVLEPQLP